MYVPFHFPPFFNEPNNSLTSSPEITGPNIPPFPKLPHPVLLPPHQTLQLLTAQARLSPPHRIRTSTYTSKACPDPSPSNINIKRVANIPSPLQAQRCSDIRDRRILRSTDLFRPRDTGRHPSNHVSIHLLAALRRLMSGAGICVEYSEEYNERRAGEDAGVR